MPPAIATASPSTPRIELALHTAYTSANSPWGVRAWRHHIVAGGVRVGTISLRDGHTHVFTHLLGHIGFAVEPAHQGHGYAGLALQALLPQARELGFETLWITTTPDNAACRRALEKLGCVLVEEVPIPLWYATYARGERSKLRYSFEIEKHCSENGVCPHF